MITKEEINRVVFELETLGGLYGKIRFGASGTCVKVGLDSDGLVEFTYEIKVGQESVICKSYKIRTEVLAELSRNEFCSVELEKHVMAEIARDEHMRF